MWKNKSSKVITGVFNCLLDCTKDLAKHTVVHSLFFSPLVDHTIINLANGLNFPYHFVLAKTSISVASTMSNPVSKSISLASLHQFSPLATAKR